MSYFSPWHDFSPFSPFSRGSVKFVRSRNRCEMRIIVNNREDRRVRSYIQGRATTERSFITNMLHCYGKKREKNVLSATFASLEEYLHSLSFPKKTVGCSQMFAAPRRFYSVSVRIVFSRIWSWLCNGRLSVYSVWATTLTFVLASWSKQESWVGYFSWRF